jgi:hypothetical protein
VDADQVDHHRLGGGAADLDRAAADLVAVVTADEHDERCHRQRFDHREQVVIGTLELPEQLEVAAGGDLADLEHDGDERADERDQDGGGVDRWQEDPGCGEAGRAEVADDVEAHYLKRVDLLGDSHRPDLGDEAG